MKRTILILIMLIMLLGMSVGVFAVPDKDVTIDLVEVDYESSVVTITAHTATSNVGDLIHIQVLNPGVTIDTADDNDAVSMYNYFETLSVPNGGKIICTYKIDGISTTSTHKYTVRIGGAGYQPSEPYYFSYMNPQGMSQLIEDFSGADAETVDSLLTDYIDFISVDEMLYNLIVDDPEKYYELCGLIAENEFENLDDIVRHSNQCLAFLKLKYYTTDETYVEDFKLYSNIVLPNLSNAVTDDENLCSDEIIALVYDELYRTIVDCADMSDLRAVADEIIVNNALVICPNPDLLVKIILTYSDFIGSYDDVVDLRLNEFKKVSYTKQIAYCKKMLNDIPQTVSELQTYLKDNKVIVDKDGGTVNRPSGNSGIHGGTSASGTTYIVPAVIDIDETINMNDVSVPFVDVSDKYWAYDSISKLYNLGVVKGKTSNVFDPEGYVTRAEYVKMLMAVSGVFYETVDCEIKDVSKDDWCYPYVASAFKIGLTYGKGDGNFGKDELVTREDMAVMLYRLAKHLNLNRPNEREFLQFVDYNDISDYAQEAVADLYSKGVISGYNDGCFNPLGYATRAETAKILVTFFVK